jgi:hypothetical protein
MITNLASIIPGVIAVAGIILTLALGVVWLVMLLRTRAKLRTMEKTLKGSVITGDTQSNSGAR